MYDMHYDLLTILYYNFKENNPKANKQKLLSDCEMIYKDNNILGGIINLYFMSESEMEEELGIEKEELSEVVSMFKRSIELLDLLKYSQVIPENIDFIYSIEGCDYFKSEEDLEELYDLGLRSILPVWNEKNKFGSGYRSEDGLTELGKRLILKAIDLGIMIDVSHANLKTFNDILDIIEEEKNNGKDITVIASHSNVKSLCDRKRNLSDEQLIRLKNVGGYIGLFTNGNFLSFDNEEIDYKERQQNFLKHMHYIIQEIGFSEDKVLISSDDMNFNPDPSYHHLESFELSRISTDLRELLEKNYPTDFTNKVMIDNAKELVKKVNKKTIKTRKTI